MKPGLIPQTEERLIQRAEKGDRAAFNELHARYQKEIYGFIRARTNNEADAKDIAQETWIEAWKRMKAYDPTRGTFRAFVKYWASIMLLRYYDARGQEHKVYTLFSELAHRFPNLEKEHSLEDIVERLRVKDAKSQIPQEAFRELLCKTFGGSSPPHQLIVFGFSKLVSLESGPPETPPLTAGARIRSTDRAEAQRIVAELSDIPLRDLAARLEERYVEESQLPQSVVRRCFKPLHEAMNRRFCEVVTDPNTRRIYPHLRDRIVGDTTLRDYYRGNPKDNITQWWYAVQRRVLRAVKRQPSEVLSDLLQGKSQRRAARKGQNHRISLGRLSENG